MPSRIGYFHEINTPHYKQWGVSPQPFTPWQTPEQDGKSKHEGTAEAQKTLWGLWSWGLAL